MKKILFVSVITLLLAVSFNAYSADGGWYMSGNIGIVMENDAGIGTWDELELEDLIGEDLPAGTTGSADLTFDMGYMLSAAVGYNFGSLRLEGELDYLMNDFDEIEATVTAPGLGSESVGVGVDGDASNLIFMINGYYDFMEGSALRPYITAGIGYAKVDFDFDDDTVMAYQVGVGMTYQSSDNMAWDIRYRYMATSDIETIDPMDIASSMDIENSTHSLTVGLIFSF